MNEISALPSNIVNWLKEREELADIKFLTEFPAIKKAVPLKNTIVAVGIDEVNITDSFMENEEGVFVNNEYCRLAKIKLRFSIHAPFDDGGEACHNAFTDIIDCLSFDSGLNITSSGCGGIVSDRDTDAFVLAAWALVDASLCPAVSSSLVFPSFLNKELLCGSHISDLSLHLSPEQRDFINSPYESGSYFGTGDASRSFTLTFAPKLVAAFARFQPFLRYDAPSGKTFVLAGAAVRDGGSAGVEIVGSGFKVSQSDSSSSDCVTRLNELGTTYFYLAFK